MNERDQSLFSFLLLPEGQLRMSSSGQTDVGRIRTHKTSPGAKGENEEKSKALLSVLQNASQERSDMVQQDEGSAKKQGRGQGKPGSREQATGHAAGRHTPPGPMLRTKPPASRGPHGGLPADDSGSAVHQLRDLGKVTYPLCASGFISKMRGTKGLL